MSISYKHPIYLNKQEKRMTVRDVIKGSKQVKDKGDAYLIRPNAIDTSMANQRRFEDYLKTAMFLGVTGRTKRGLIGAIFRRDSKIEIPPEMEFILEDVDGDGQSLVSLAKWAGGELMEVDSFGLLIDYPQAPERISRREEREMFLRPVMARYEAESIINWRYTKVGGKRFLSMVVLSENIQEDIGEYESKQVTQYRVLRLDQGIYTQTLYNQDGIQKDETMSPRMAGGKPWKQIPFVFAEYDEVPLYDLSVVNLSHYQNSADYEENIFIHSQATLFINPGDMGADDFVKMNPNGILVGSRTGHVLGNGGSAMLLQSAPNNAARQAMQDKEAQMISIGARLITQGSGNKSIDEVRIAASSESSVLSDIAYTSSEAIEKALEFVAMFIGADPNKVLFKLNQDFFDTGYVPQEAMAHIQELDRGLISKSVYRDYLRRVSVIPSDVEDDDIDAENLAEGNGQLI